jgi:hypothetical protein
MLAQWVRPEVSALSGFFYEERGPTKKLLAAKSTVLASTERRAGDRAKDALRRLRRTCSIVVAPRSARATALLVPRAPPFANRALPDPCEAVIADGSTVQRNESGAGGRSRHPSDFKSGAIALQRLLSITPVCWLRA